MPVIHFPNVTFEKELEGTQGALPAKLEQLAQELAVLIGLRAAPGDVVLVEPSGRPQAAGLPDCLTHARYLTLPELRELLAVAEGASSLGDWQLSPWGWSASAVRLLHLLGLPQSAPDILAIRRVNTREFAAEFDVMLSADGDRMERPFSRLCDSEQQVLAALQELTISESDRWVIKANLSHAARNRLLGQGRELSAEQSRWLSRRLQNSERVCVEPWVHRLRECGLQWTVDEQAGQLRVTFDGAAEMLTDSPGQYRGSLIGGSGCCPGTDIDSANWWQPAIDHGRRVATAAGKLGFRGPLGIDCMLLQHAGRQWLRPAHDINGRQTMGRLALSLARWLPEGFCGAWCHVPAGSPGIEADFSCIFSGCSVRGQRTSPLQTGGRQPVLQTQLLCGENPASVTAAAMKLTQAVVPSCLPSKPDPGTHP
jgi:hypothetical protein